MIVLLRMPSTFGSMAELVIKTEGIQNPIPNLLSNPWYSQVEINIKVLY